jgi:hypothetical protein
MSYIRTPEHRALRAALIHRWRPWEQSTGPKSQEGKERSAMRGFKGSERPMLRELSQALKSQENGLAVFDY